MSKEKLVPPEDLVIKCEEISGTKGFLISAGAFARPYLEGGEWGDDWKIELVDTKTNIVIMRHLTLEEVPHQGHALYLAIDAMRKAWEHGVQYGMALAAHRQTEQIYKTIGLKLLTPPATRSSGYEKPDSRF